MLGTEGGAAYLVSVSTIRQRNPEANGSEGGREPGSMANSKDAGL